MQGKRFVVRFRGVDSPSLESLFVRRLRRLVLSNGLRIKRGLPPRHRLTRVVRIDHTIIGDKVDRLRGGNFLAMGPHDKACITSFQEGNALSALVTVVGCGNKHVHSRRVHSVFRIHVTLSALTTRLTVSAVDSGGVRHLLRFIGRVHSTRSIAATVRTTCRFRRRFTLVSKGALVPLVFRSFQTPVFGV